MLALVEEVSPVIQCHTSHSDHIKTYKRQERKTHTKKNDLSTYLHFLMFTSTVRCCPCICPSPILLFGASDFTWI